jgi:hypothetical protein
VELLSHREKQTTRAGGTCLVLCTGTRGPWGRNYHWPSARWTPRLERATVAHPVLGRAAGLATGRPSLLALPDRCQIAWVDVRGAYGASGPASGESGRPPVRRRPGWSAGCACAGLARFPSWPRSTSIRLSDAQKNPVLRTLPIVAGTGFGTCDFRVMRHRPEAGCGGNGLVA